MEKSTKDVIRFWMTRWKEPLMSYQWAFMASLCSTLRAPKNRSLATSSQAHKLTHRPTDRVAGGADAGSGDSWQLLVPVQASHLGNNRSKVSKAGRSNHRGSVIPEEEVRGRWPRGPLGSSVSVGFTSVGVRQSGESCGCRLQLPGSSPAR